MSSLRFLQDYQGVETGEQLFLAGYVLTGEEEIDVEELLSLDILAQVVPGEPEEKVKPEPEAKPKPKPKAKAKAKAKAKSKGK